MGPGCRQLSGLKTAGYRLRSAYPRVAQRCFNVPIFRTAGSNHRGNLFVFFTLSEESMLSGMRVDRTYADFSPFDSGFFKYGISAHDCARSQARFDSFNGIQQADMRGHMDDPQARCGQHHRYLRCRGERCQQFRMPRKFRAAGIQCLLVKGRGTNCLRLSGDHLIVINFRALDILHQHGAVHGAATEMQLCV